jgi:hypothetical protein
MKSGEYRALKGNLKTLVASSGALAAAGVASQAGIVYTSVNRGAGFTASGSGSIWFSLSGQSVSTSSSSETQFRLYFNLGIYSKPTIHALASYSGVVVNSSFYGDLLSGGDSHRQQQLLASRHPLPGEWCERSLEIWRPWIHWPQDRSRRHHRLRVGGCFLQRGRKPYALRFCLR